MTRQKTTDGTRLSDLSTPRGKLYKTWKGIKDRCNNPNSLYYLSYGGRGIKVAPEWQHDFFAFEAHMGVRPSPGHTIYRIDNDGNYEPGNVRWATKKEQANNRRPRTDRGDRSAMVRISDAKVREMRETYALGGVTQRELAARFHVSRTLTSGLLRGQRRPEAGGPVVQVAYRWARSAMPRRSA